MSRFEPHATEIALARSERIIICCKEAVERSPLAMVWYLHRRRNSSIGTAYELVRSKRPEVLDRSVWLNG